MNNNTTLHIDPLPFLPSTKLPFIIAGPCSAETQEQVLCTAKQLKDAGFTLFRAGVWKPRTKPGGFEGNGEKALPWLKQVQSSLNMPVAIEVATPEHVHLALKHGITILWIGARTTTNPFAIQAIADALEGHSDVCVLVKNPISPDLELWLGALERINRAGITKLAAIHRGFSSYQNKLYRNVPMWQIPIELRRRVPELPVFCDPSHIGGARHLVAPISQQALDLGFEGLIIETHCAPDEAWSDATQQITPDVLADIVKSLTLKTANNGAEEIALLRTQIDELDKQLLELLGERMSISRQIGKYKKQRNMTVLQSIRYNELLKSRCEQGKIYHLSCSFVESLFENIHEESVKQQL